MTSTDQIHPATNHTPGPWKVTHTKFGLHRIDCEERGNHGIGVVMSNVGSLPNARLIAAAPELLEALEGIAAWADDSKYKIDCGDSERRIWFYNTLEKARAAIAKAKGAAA